MLSAVPRLLSIYLSIRPLLAWQAATKDLALLIGMDSFKLTVLVSDIFYHFWHLVLRLFVAVRCHIFCCTLNLATERVNLRGAFSESATSLEDLRGFKTALILLKLHRLLPIVPKGHFFSNVSRFKDFHFLEAPLITQPVLIFDLVDFKEKLGLSTWHILLGVQFWKFMLIVDNSGVTGRFCSFFTSLPFYVAQLRWCSIYHTAVGAIFFHLSVRPGACILGYFAWLSLNNFLWCLTTPVILITILCFYFFTTV